MRVLNVGGNTKDIPLPELYDGWEHYLLDIDEKANPDILCDARNMFGIKEKFDSVYCSHTLEHFYPHEVPKVLQGFKHVLDKNGFVYIKVPDLEAVIQKVAKGMRLDEPLYTSQMGTITPLDMIYGHHGEIERSGHDYFAHKIGYSKDLLQKYLKDFRYTYVYPINLELYAAAGDQLLKDPFE